MRFSATIQSHTCDGEASLQLDSLGDAISLISNATEDRIIYVGNNVVVHPEEIRSSRSDVREDSLKLLVIGQERQTFYVFSTLVAFADALLILVVLGFTEGLDSSTWGSFCFLTIFPDIIFATSCLSSSWLLQAVALSVLSLNFFSPFVFTNELMLWRFVFVGTQIGVLVRNRSFLAPTVFSL